MLPDVFLSLDRSAPLPRWAIAVAFAIFVIGSVLVGVAEASRRPTPDSGVHSIPFSS